MNVYIVHLNYGCGVQYKFDPQIGHYKPNNHLVRCPDGSGKVFNCPDDMFRWLTGKLWRYAS